MRTVTDFRALNAITVKDTNPLPRIDNIFDSLRNARYLSTFDITSAFYSIGLDEESIPKTAFSADFTPPPL